MTKTSAPHLRRRDLPVTRVDEDAFVVVPATEAVFHLNALGRALWDLLALPCRADDLTAAIAEAFPDQPPARIAQDVTDFLARMETAGLVTRDAEPS